MNTSPIQPWSFFSMSYIGCVAPSETVFTMFEDACSGRVLTSSSNGSFYSARSRFSSISSSSSASSHNKKCKRSLHDAMLGGLKKKASFQSTPDDNVWGWGVDASIWKQHESSPDNKPCAGHLRSSAESDYDSDYDSDFDSEFKFEGDKRPDENDSQRAVSMLAYDMGYGESYGEMPAATLARFRRRQSAE